MRGGDWLWSVFVYSAEICAKMIFFINRETMAVEPDWGSAMTAGWVAEAK